MIREEQIVQIRERASIVEVVSDYLTLKKAGRNYVGLCPFHAEKTPSFTVSDEKGIYHCFGGCGAGGNVFHFLMQYDHLTFPEAVERVAKRYGIAIQRADGVGRRADAGEKESLYELNQKAATYYHHVLFDQPEGKKGRDYLKARGVDESVARRFFLGYAPQSGPGLLHFLQRERLSLKDALRLGLIGEKGPQRYHEKFFARLMFPIVNPAGKVTGFGGRVLTEGLPKYLNSSETPLFRKGASLYGMFHAKEGIRKADRVVVVEGYLDVIALAQFGVSYAVATLGTALTPDHVRILGRYTKNIIALFDGDEAGTKAAARSFEIFIEGGLLGRAAFLPAGEDPDTFVRTRGKEGLEETLERAVPLADYYFSWLERRYGDGLEGKGRIAREVSRLLAKVRNPFEVDLLVARAVDRLGVREELLRRSSRPAAGSRSSMAFSDAANASRAAAREDMAERCLIALMLCFPSVIRAVESVKEMDRLVDVKWRGVVEGILAEWRERGEVDVARLTQRILPEQAAQLAAIALEGERIGEEECEKMAVDCLDHLQRRYLRSLEKSLRIAIRAAEEQKNETVKRERILEWQDVVRKKRQLGRQRFALKTEIR